jgi:hypothetical protein
MQVSPPPMQAGSTAYITNYTNTPISVLTQTIKPSTTQAFPLNTSTQKFDIYSQSGKLLYSELLPSDSIIDVHTTFLVINKNIIIDRNRISVTFWFIILVVIFAVLLYISFGGNGKK